MGTCKSFVERVLAKILRKGALLQGAIDPAPEPLVPKPLVPLGVGEPVVSFVNLVLANPHRFKITKAIDSWYTLKDRLTSESWVFHIDYDTGKYMLPRNPPKVVGFGAQLSWISTQEAYYLYAMLYPYYSDRERRLRRITGERKARPEIKRNLAERARLMQIYCNG